MPARQPVNLTTPLASFFAFDAGFGGGVRVAPHAGSSVLLLLTTGPGGAGFAKAVAVGILPGGPVNTGVGYVPFDVSPLGVFPSQ